MGKLINGRVRFDRKPQPFVEMSDKFYFFGQGYTKYSLSPIKNDFSDLCCNSSVFGTTNNTPVAKSIVNLDYYRADNNVAKSNVLGSDNMLIVDCVDSNIEYMLTNPVEGSVRLVKFDRRSKTYTITSNLPMSGMRRASIIGQSENKIYISTDNSSYLSISSVDKALMTSVTLLSTSCSHTGGDLLIKYNAVYENEDIILLGCITSGSTNVSIDNFAPAFVVVNKIVDNASVSKIDGGTDETYGSFYFDTVGKCQLSGCSNAVIQKDKVSVYFLGARRDTANKRYSTLIKMEYDLKTLKTSYKEFTPKDGFNIDHLNDRFIVDRSYCKLELHSNGDIDTVNIFDGFTDSKIANNYPNKVLKSGITTFRVDTFTRKVEQIAYSDISDNDFMYYALKVSDGTLAVITDSSIVYCSKDYIDNIYRVMNIEHIASTSFVMKDSDNNIWSIDTSGNVYKHDGAKTKVNMYCKFEKDKYEYKDREISTNVIVGIKDYITGKLVKGNVILKLSDNCVFRGNETNTINITTSDVVDIKLPVIIKGSGALRTQIEINFDTEE